MSTTTSELKIDGSPGKVVADHLPELYSPGREAELLPGLGAVDDNVAASFAEHGYFAVEGVFTAEEVQGALDAIEDLVTGKNASFNGVFFEAAARQGLEQADARSRLDFVRKLQHFVKYDERLDRLANHPAVLATVKRLMGKEPTLYQDQALLKPPKIGREKPWHQDLAYFDVRVTDRVTGVWVALDPATVENGCMQVLDGGHKQGPILHWSVRDWQICDTEILGKSSVACPLPPGGALFFDSLLPHGTPTNHSPLRRRALQFHYCAADAEKITGEERLKVFGTEGKDVTC